MALISYSEHGENPLSKLLGHNPVLAQQWLALLNSFYKHCDLPSDLQEEVRRAVAYKIGCAYCMSHGCETLVITDPKIRVACEFAKKVVQTDRKITADDILPLKTYFNDKQIAELSQFICYGLGLARFGAVLNVDVS